MPSSTYVARTPAAFSALLQTAEIGGIRLQPFAPISVRDAFFDTPTGELLASGLILRVREQGGARTAALRRLRPEADGEALPEDVQFERGQENRLVPPGPFAEAVRRRVGAAPLGRVLSLRQNRTARVGMEGGRAVALFSLDVVAYDLASPLVSNEVEVEPLGEATETHALRIHDDLVGRGLSAVTTSKFERGIVRVPRSLREALLLTPSERDALEAASRSGSPLLQRRARVVLLDARGLRPDTIAAQTGLGMARVRHWRLRFRDERLGILAEETSAPGPRTASRPRTASGPRPGAQTPGSQRPGPPERPPVAPEVGPTSATFDSEPSPEPVASPPSGDGATPAPPEPDPPEKDLSDLLDLFSPRDPGTPLLEDADGPKTEPQREAAVAEATRSRTAFPVVLGPVAPTPTQVVREATAERGSPRRPALTGETPLVVAAEATIAYHVAALDAAVDRFLSGRGVVESRRLLIAVHRVRLGIATFRRLLPETAAARLMTSLRPLAVHLDRVLDAARAAEAAAPDVRPSLDARRASAVAALRVRLGG
ncbi:MAG: CYTH domain-containing protein, partial [Bacteroidota bacterium]